MLNDIPNVACRTTFPADTQELRGAIPNGITPNRVELHLYGFQLALDYFIQIHSD
jgi:hypothetical protein